MVHQIIFIALCLAVSQYAPQIAILFTLLLGVILLSAGKVTIRKESLFLFKFPFLLVIIGSIHAPFNNGVIAIQDAVNYLVPILALLYGYLLSKRLPARLFLMNIIGISSFVSFMWLLRLDPSKSYESIYYYKMDVGLLSILVAISFSVIISLIISKIKVMKPMMLYPLAALQVTALVLTYSRTFWVVVAVITLTAFVLNSLAYFRITRIVSMLGLIILAVIVGLGVKDVEQSDRSTFLGKVLTSGSELKPSEYDTRQEIQANWRGYEAYRAYLAYSNASWEKLLFGHGFGKTADLGITIKLKDKDYSEVYRFHNGFANILLKTGIIGLLIYLIFMLKFFIKGAGEAIKPKNRDTHFLWSLFAGLSLSILASTVSISGWLNREGLMIGIILLGFIYGILTDVRSKYYMG